MERQLQETADGSHTLFVPSLDEHYHSINGAVQESRHVFIEAGWQALPPEKEEVRILEIGFGTGLNAFLTLWETMRPCREGGIPFEKGIQGENRAAGEGGEETGIEAGEETRRQTAGNPPLSRKVTYYAVERYPLEPQTIRTLNYGEKVWPERKGLFEALHQAPWDADVPVTDSFVIHKIAGDARACALPEHIDLIYFDAFAPDKQPELWTPALFDRLYAAAAPGALFVTYCAKGEVRRNLQAAGFRMERLPGPPGKRHMLRGKSECSDPFRRYTEAKEEIRTCKG